MIAPLLALLDGTLADVARPLLRADDLGCLLYTSDAADE